MLLVLVETFSVSPAANVWRKGRKMWEKLKNLLRNAIIYFRFRLWAEWALKPYIRCQMKRLREEFAKLRIFRDYTSLALVEKEGSVFCSSRFPTSKGHEVGSQIQFPCTTIYIGIEDNEALWEGNDLPKNTLDNDACYCSSPDLRSIWRLLHPPLVLELYSTLYFISRLQDHF